MTSSFKFSVDRPNARTIASQAVYVGQQESDLRESFVKILENERLPVVSGQRWVLTQQEHDAANRARDFIRQRYHDLGITDLPQTYGPFFYPTDSWRYEGVAVTAERWFGISEANPKIKGEFLVGLMIHEITHALGAVRLNARAINTTAPLLSGLTMSALVDRAYVPIFKLLEEYVASANERLFITSQGFKESGVPVEFSYEMGNSDLDETIFRAYLEIHRPHQFALLEAEARLLRNGWDELVTQKKITSFPMHVDCLVTLPLSGEGPPWWNGYTTDIIALDKLANQIFPSLPKHEANAAFRDAAIVAHVTGDYMPLFKRIKHNLGATGVKMLAFASPGGITQRGLCSLTVTPSNLLLSLFADAQKLPPERCAELRQRLVSKIDPRRGSETSSSD